MKRKIWVVSPLMYFLAAVLIAMALLDYKDNIIIFTVEITVAVISLLAVLII